MIVIVIYLDLGQEIVGVAWEGVRTLRVCPNSSGDGFYNIYSTTGIDAPWLAVRPLFAWGLETPSKMGVQHGIQH